MYLSDFDYIFPEELIAQQPLPKRDSSRMMVCDRKSRSCKHSRITDFPEYLKKSDVLVFNNTKVIPARLFGRRKSGGEIEILLTKNLDIINFKTWQCIAKKTKRLHIGEDIIFGDNFSGKILAKDEQYITIEFETKDFLSEIERYGVPPLPPYIKRKGIASYTDVDKKRYQTIYAKNLGSVAAPTAGLHFSETLVNSIKGLGVEVLNIALHVSLDTFAPVREDIIENHKMHGEIYQITDETARALNSAKKEGRRIIAVGTTTVRTLEAASQNGEIKPGEKNTNIFIYPGFKFQIVDALLTNFHQPKSTLIMMVSAFAGREFILNMYKKAIEEHYRLFSYGDCMLIL
jgi:S-adenosylmethionine:tRNA ribosyltransferase-isomerase